LTIPYFLSKILCETYNPESICPEGISGVG
jgi:hypothetical protein